jgi:hypothetical protein
MQKLLILLALSTSCASPSVQLCSDSVVPVAHGTIGGRSAELGGLASFGELGVEDVESVGSSPRVDIRGEAGTLSFGYMPATYAGEGTLAADLQVGGETFERDSGVSTVMGADFMTARWTQDLVNTAPLRVGLGVGFCGLGLKMKVQELDGSGEGEFDELIPLPMAVAKLEGDLGRLDFEASYGVHETRGSDGERRLQDLDARFSMDIKGSAGALVFGYREVQLDGTHSGGGESTAFDVAFGGPYIGLTLGF